MDRRDFLKTLGLGGLALALPKPLEVVAARMADLKGPPVHVGFCEFRGLEGLVVDDLSICGFSQSPEEMDELFTNWTIYATLRRDERSFVPLLEAPVEKLLVVARADRVPCLPPSEDGRLTSPGCAMSFSGRDAIEVWAAPRRRPRCLMPRLSAVLSARVAGGPHDGHRKPRISLELRQVRLERARAIELGLVSVEEPYDIV